MKIYVLASSYEDAREFAYKKEFHYSDMSYIHTPEKLRGLRNVKLYVLPEAPEHKNFSAIIQEAKLRGLDIEYV